jgi:integrase
MTVQLPKSDVTKEAYKSSNHVQRSIFEGKVLNTLFKLRSLGKTESTLRFVSDRLKYLSRFVDLDDPESVNIFIANKKCSEAYKETFVKAYSYYAKFNNIPYVKPSFHVERKLPKIPTREQIEKIIANSSRKYATIFKILLETGIMPYELSRVKLEDIDIEKGVITVRGFKGHTSRIFKLKDETVAMLKEYLKRYGSSKQLFPSSLYMCKMWRKFKKKTAIKLQDPSLLIIRLYDLRHFYATMLYYRTKDILLVKQQLGHRKIETTMIYTQLVNFNEDEYYSATARNVQEAQKLIENGFEYVTTFEGIMIFRKRK